jgi:hypothetical protein
VERKWWTLLGGLYRSFRAVVGRDDRQRRAAFGLDKVLLIAAIVALAAAVLTAALIRPRDLASSKRGGEAEIGRLRPMPSAPRLSVPTKEER